MDNSIDYKRLGLVQGLLDKAVEDKFVAGAACLVVKDNKELCYFESGHRDIENDLKITRDTIYRMFSMSKPVTAIAAMQLVERGVISLGDPVSDYLPGFKNQKYYDNGKISDVIDEMTIKNLLDMTSGLCYPGESCEAERETAKLFDAAAAKIGTPDEIDTVTLMNELGKLPLAFAPGESWNYGLSADVMGAVIETVTGMKYSEYLKKNIFDPLEMNDTGFYVPKDKSSRLAKSYDSNGTEFIENIGENLLIRNRMEEMPQFESGGAGLVSTIDDYSKICGMFLNGGTYKGRHILHPETIRYMSAAGLNAKQKAHIGNWNSLAGCSYSCFMRVMEEPGQAMSLGSKGEFGWDGWLGVYETVIPEHNMYILYMQQKPDTGTTEFTLRLRNVIFSSIIK